MNTRLRNRLGLRCGLAAAGAVLCLCAKAAPPGASEPARDAPAAVVPAVEEYVPPEDPSELLKIDDEMRRYFGKRLSPRGNDRVRLSQLVDAILKPDGLNFAYETTGTFAARETFRRRRGNCASYAFLVVAVARAFGFDAAFQNIDRASRWSRVGELVVVVQHLDVRTVTYSGTYVIDLDPEVIPTGNPESMKVISDDTAFAQFYCNVGFQRLVDHQPAESLRYMALATRIDPGYGNAWANRANLHARLGDLAAAKQSFQRSLRANPRGEAALEGFVEVLRRLGTPEDLAQAAKLERRAQALREHNPYYQEYQAEQARGRGDLAAAEKLLRRAISLKSDEPAFYVQWVAVLEQLGRSGDAHRAAGKLDKLRLRLAAESRLVPP